VHTYSVQFRISGARLDPHEITRQMGLEPNQIRIAGERRSKTQVWQESLWSYDGGAASAGSANEWTSLEEGLLYVLDKLSAKKELIQKYAESYEVVWWCGHFQSGFDGGPTLSTSLLKLLAGFDVSLFIDNYFRNDP
jgi:hypothetical protein